LQRAMSPTDGMSRRWTEWGGFQETVWTI
jgi:hypothetical protein